MRNKPQRNAYHRFTVDRHLLEAAANAAELAPRVDRPDLLVVGALLHDIGKGFPGDHTEVGIGLVATIARRMGFAPGDVETLVAMCRYHLLLPDTATRRDLDDPATIDTVAKAAGDVGTLELLGTLTEADSLATGPSAWGSWKAGLVAELVERARRQLEGQSHPDQEGLGHRRPPLGHVRGACRRTGRRRARPAPGGGGRPGPPRPPGLGGRDPGPPRPRRAQRRCHQRGRGRRRGVHRRGGPGVLARQHPAARGPRVGAR